MRRGPVRWESLVAAAYLCAAATAFAHDASSGPGTHGGRGGGGGHAASSHAGSTGGSFHGATHHGAASHHGSSAQYGHAQGAINSAAQHFAVPHHHGAHAGAHSVSSHLSGHAGRQHSASFPSGRDQQATGLKLASMNQLGQPRLSSQFLARHSDAPSFDQRQESHNFDGNVMHGGGNNSLVSHHHQQNASSQALLFGFFPSFGYGYGAGNGSGFAAAGYGGGIAPPRYAYNIYGVPAGSNSVDSSDIPVSSRWPTAVPPMAELIGQFAAQGEDDFKRGKYDGAVRYWQHAIVDDPANGTLMLMIAQALFAIGRFDEAAGAVQQAMFLLPEDQWGVVVVHNTELYPRVGVYAAQLRALEQAVRENRDAPGLRFLVGYHYGYLGHARQAVAQLENAKRLAPEDKLSQMLIKRFGAKIDKPDNQPAERKSAPPVMPRANVVRDV
jgi:hypothetical protein